MKTRNKPSGSAVMTTLWPTSGMAPEVAAAAGGAEGRARWIKSDKRHTKHGIQSEARADAPRGHSRLKHALKKIRWMAFERESFSELNSHWNEREPALSSGR